MYLQSVRKEQTVLSLGAVIAIFSGIMYFQVKISGTNNYLPTSTSLSERYHLIMTFFGILLTFTPMHFLGFNVMPRRIPDFPDYFNSWNYLSSIGSGITLICWLYISMGFQVSFSWEYYWNFRKSLIFQANLHLSALVQVFPIQITFFCRQKKVI